MSAADALKIALDAGVHVTIDGDDLVLEAAVPPPPAVLDLLSRHKPGIAAHLRSVPDSWSGDDWRAFFDERAGIAEFDGGLPRQQAEARAFACCIAEWLDQNPVASSPGHCLGCGKGEHAQDPLLPFGIERTGHVWLHSHCLPAWHASRETEAVAALAVIGLQEERTDQWRMIQATRRPSSQLTNCGGFK